MTATRHAAGTKPAAAAKIPRKKRVVPAKRTTGRDALRDCLGTVSRRLARLDSLLIDPAAPIDFDPATPQGNALVQFQEAVMELSDALVRRN